ncbi:hypothetical protein C4K06_5102 [Pseudomonas chlororaphis subsp. aureofaciens]|uniref:hypothetical protein n=1 Tax=Pseudomonas chlororaphis TaxID=587753 RepID=UPI000F57C94F|nr:hypothetical protein [Pseudomonas chlororaphis]AZE38111.1 hypothetical protein C4K06_5102 [Pseudomonas chlororaphis subsp. aureofaciens]
MDDDLNIEATGFQIAGVDLHCLLLDMDEIELAVSELALYSHFYEHFKEGFDLIHHAQAFWLEDGVYAQYADSTIQTMFRKRDDIEQHYSFAEASSLPEVARQFVGSDHPAPDSKLIATYALVQAVQAVEALANWLFDLELSVYDLEADLVELMRQTDPKQYLKLIDRARDRSSGFEIRSREEFAIYKGEADKTLMLASLYSQLESVDVSTPGFNAHGFLRVALGNVTAAQASLRGKAAGKGNSNPESDKQQAATKRFERICKAADRHISADPKISGTDLVKALVEKDNIASIPTIKKYLFKGRYLPR